MWKVFFNENFSKKVEKLFPLTNLLFVFLLFSLQITIIERQVFDFLGYMWAPIFVNFFHILFIIFGFYGAYHFRIKYIITVSSLFFEVVLPLLHIDIHTYLVTFTQSECFGNWNKNGAKWNFVYRLLLVSGDEIRLHELQDNWNDSIW